MNAKLKDIMFSYLFIYYVFFNFSLVSRRLGLVKCLAIVLPVYEKYTKLLRHGINPYFQLFYEHRGRER